MGLSKTLLDIDAVKKGKLTGKDLNEKDILRLLDENQKEKIIVTPIGGNGNEAAIKVKGAVAYGV